MGERGDDTVAYYDRHAARFAADTGGLDLSELYDCFLRHVPAGGRILDAGCGVGRDALAFSERGYPVVALDASAEMVRLARERVGRQFEVVQLRFDELEWREEFDGIWACASLLHVPVADFPAVAIRLVSTLRPGGAWYMSFKHGRGERADGGRLFIDHDEASLRSALRHAPVEVLDVWTSEDARPDRAGEHWLNAVAVKR